MKNRTTNTALLNWVKEMANLCQPDKIHWCDGSPEEYNNLCAQMVSSGTMIPLNPAKRKNCFLARSHVSDVARIENRTFICSEKAKDAGPTNNWMDPVAMKKILQQIFKGAMRGRTMGSETTAAAIGQAAIRHDPFAMLPFVGYHMADYWQHWLKMGTAITQPPKIFRVNWFRKNQAGKFMWEGYGQNLRVIKWIIDRIAGSVGTNKTPLGYIPKYEDMVWAGMSFSKEKFEQLMLTTHSDLVTETSDLSSFLKRFADRIPIALEQERKKLAEHTKI